MVKRGTNHDEGGAAGLICRNGDGGGALRFLTGALRQMKAAIARVLGLQMPAKGTGRLGLEDCMAYPGSVAPTGIKYFEALKAIGKVMSYYKDYPAIKLGCRKAKDVIPLKTIDPRQPLIDQLPWLLWALSTQGEIVFAPVPEGASDIHVLWLHDVPESSLSALPQRSLVVETGERRYDCHIYVGAALRTSEITGWQRVLCAIHGSSRGFVAHKAYRALPGFRGEHSFTVTIREDIVPSGTLWLGRLKAQIENQERLQREAASRVTYRDGHDRWAHFWHADRTDADTRYAEHLLGLGYDGGEVSDILLAESEDIVLREGQNLGAYLTRIVSAAQRKHAQRITGRLV